MESSNPSGLLYITYNMPFDLEKIKSYIKPPQVGGEPTGQPVGQPAEPPPAHAGFDLERIKSYIAPQGEPAQAQPAPVAPKPPVVKPTSEQPRQATTYAPPPKAPEYTKGPVQPAATAGNSGLIPSIAKHALNRWYDAQNVVEGYKKDVAEAGQGQYVQVGGIGDILTNIGQNPTIGKGATAIGKAASTLWQAVDLMNIPAEATERVFGDVLAGRAGDLREQLGIGNDPVKEQAYQAALGVSYSGRTSMINAYKDALQLSQAGQLSPENLKVVQAKHGKWWAEAAGQIILDPLNLVDAVGMGAKGIKASKWIAGGERMFIEPLVDNAGKLANTADVVADMSRLNTRAGQLKESETLLDKGLAYLNPRLSSSVVHRNAVRMSQIVDTAAGITAKRAILQAGGDTAKAVAIAGEEFQKVAELWARLASDSADDVVQAADTLNKLGYGSVPTSAMGRRTGVVMRAIMQKQNGEYGDLLGSLKLSKEAGLNAEQVAEAWYNKAAKVLDGMMQEQGFETSAVQRGAKAILKARRPADRLFGALFMGLNPGYAFRNFYDNMGRMLINGYSPLTPVSHIEKQLGFTIRGAHHGIGQAEGAITGLPFTKWAEEGEKFAAWRVSDQAYLDALNRLWPKAMAQLGEIPAELQPFLRDLIKRDISALDKLGAKAVLPPTAEAPVIEAWRVLDNTTVDALNQIDPHLHEHIIKALDDAKTPEEALAQIRQLQYQYANHVAGVAKAEKMMGPAAGTVTGQIVDITAQTGKLKLEPLTKLSEDLSAIEHSIRVSRSRAYSAAAQSVKPEDWTVLLQKNEAAFDDAMQEILKRQMAGYAKLMAGELSTDKYAQHLRKIYIEAKNKLDQIYSRVIGEAGGPEFSGTTENVIPNLMQWLLSREALVAGYPSAVIKSGAPANLEQVFHSAYRAGETVPDAHFYNKIRQLLRDMPNIAPGRDKEIEHLSQLTVDEALYLVNRFRELRGNVPFYTLNEVAETFANRLNPAMLMEYPASRTLAILPADEMLDMQRLSQAADPQVRQAAQVALSAVEVATSPTGLDAAYETATEATRMLESLIDGIRERSLQAPLTLSNNYGDLFARARQLYTDTHMVASEVARRARDFTLLDYNDRRYFDPLLKVIYPWHYWYSRSVPNWAVSLISRPAMAAHYMKFKKELRDYNNNDPLVPEWAKEHVVLHPVGYPGAMYWDFDAAFNAIGTLYDSYSDPERSKDALGRIIQTLSTGGPAVHPLLVMAYAAERGLLEGDTAAMRSYGYLSGLTRGFANLTGKTVEPWLWLKDPITGKPIPWTGGASWDMEKAVRKLGHNQAKGLVGPEAALLGAATQAGPEFQATLVNDIAQYRRIPLFLSLLTGIRVNVRQDWENEIADVNMQYTNLKKAGKDDEASALLGENPWLSTVWMSWDNEASRIKMLANSVLNRIPPMKGEDRQAILDKAGLSPELLDMFYETTKNNPDALTSWDRRDYERFSNAILDMAELLAVPDAKTAREWRDARSQSQAMYTRLEEKYPQAQDQQRMYFEIKTNQGEEAARVYLEATNLRDYWADLNKQLLANPLVLKYYQEPGKVDTLAESLAFEALNQKYPGIFDLRQQYAQIEDYQEKREFRRLHPEVTAGYDEQKALIRQFREELTSQRKLTQSGQQVPETVSREEADWIVRGYPNATQRGLLNTIKDLQLEATRPVPTPPEKPEKLSQEDKARYAAQDRIYAQVVQQFPQLPDLEREYRQIESVYGKDSANLWAKQNGLFQARDALTIAEMTDDSVFRGMSDKSVDWAAKVMVRQRANQMFPGIEQVLDMYFALPEGSRERKAMYKANPNIGAYYKFRDQAEPYYKQQLYNYRAQLRGG